MAFQSPVGSLSTVGLQSITVSQTSRLWPETRTTTLAVEVVAPLAGPAVIVGPSLVRSYVPTESTVEPLKREDGTAVPWSELSIAWFFRHEQIFAGPASQTLRWTQAFRDMASYNVTISVSDGLTTVSGWLQVCFLPLRVNQTPYTWYS